MPHHPILYKSGQAGYSLVFAVPMSLLLLAGTLAFLKWQVAAQTGAKHQIAVTQAYYIAQAAVIAVPLAYMRNQRPGFNPTGDIAFPDGTIDRKWRYRSPLISYITAQGMQPGQYIQQRDYLLSATGCASYEDYLGHRKQVARTAKMLVRKRLFSNYFYFTDIEQTRFGEYIWFFIGDSILGRAHSNTDIGVHTGAYFSHLVTTHGRIRSPEGSTFLRGYIEGVSYIPIPVRADRLRAAAANGGTWLSSNGFQYTYGLQFNGTSALLWRWQTGTPSPYGDLTQAVGQITWSPSCDYAIFCDGDLWIKGVVRGRLGIGAQGNLRLMDNIVYTDAQNYGNLYEVPGNSSNAMTLVSEAPEPSFDREDPWTGILIANTPENGRENGGRLTRTPQSRHDIAICGQLFALNSSVTIEDQNDPWDAYISPTNPDERGTIYLRGAICMHRRGFVHRSNRGGTGYLKSWDWDPRWEYNTSLPPFQEDLTSNGFQKWDVMGWEDTPPVEGRN